MLGFLDFFSRPHVRSRSREILDSRYTSGANTAQAEERLLSQALSPFNVKTRTDALEMARLYWSSHCFENEVRALIRETLAEKERPIG